jgi:uncharacterized protein YbjQ (UPF0145 family)
MILTTTDSIQGFKIADYLGIVNGVVLDYSKPAMTSAKIKKNFLDTLNNAKEDAFQQLRDNGKALGANAIVGITVDIETSASVIVSVTGTAVKVAI